MKRRTFLSLAAHAPVGVVAVAASTDARKVVPVAADGFRHTMNDWGSLYLMPYLNGEPFKWAKAVDTAAGIIYGFVHHGNYIPSNPITGDLENWIYRGKVELRVNETLSDERATEAQKYLDQWAKAGGTPIAEFEEYVKPWQHLTSVL